MNQPNRGIGLIKQEAANGSIDAYNELRIVYLDSDAGEFLFYALLMANKHDYPQAYLDVFYALVHGYVGGIEDFDKMDKKTQKLALEYLIKAKKKGVKDAGEIYKQLKNR
ncbi:MAG: hypothetical protein IT258_17170 [Saprospiraceae bacterium]|nr:hypothetical protein [Saprospiraceae bacterium]